MNSNYGRCPTCGVFDRKDTHICDPIYGVWVEDDEIEDANGVRASSPEDAAEKFVSDRYADFECPEEIIVFVTDYGGHTWKFEVLSEQTITHNAVEVK